jgi:hypothetical protein
MSTPHFWFSLLLVCVLLLLPVMMNRFFWFDTHPTYADRLRVRSKMPEYEQRDKEAAARFVFKYALNYIHSFLDLNSPEPLQQEGADEALSALVMPSPILKDLVNLLHGARCLGILSICGQQGR